MKNISRRNFLKHTSLASSALLIPSFLKGFSYQSLGKDTGKVLVIIQWSGGNDGLNTVIPYHNDIYYKNRPRLGVKAENVLKLNDELGLNPVMTGMKSLYDEGYVSIINSVGYPNPVRSHFRSMDIWQTGSSATDYLQTGWIGRYLDQNCKGCKPYTALEVDDTLSLAMKGIDYSGFAAANIKQLRKTTSNPFHQQLLHHHSHDHEENVAYLYKTMIDTHASSNYLFQQSKIYKSTVQYPLNRFGNSLKQVAELIVANTDTKIYYLDIGGFDTHVNQKNQQERLLKMYADGMKSFVADLKQNNRFDDTLIMTFSEFGRRVKQNASGGTDHGTANNLYLMGGNLRKAGIYNAAPDLTDLDNGDLKYKIDFRRVYASVLENWLGVPSQPILGEQFAALGIV